MIFNEIYTNFISYLIVHKPKAPLVQLPSQNKFGSCELYSTPEIPLVAPRWCMPWA